MKRIFLILTLATAFLVSRAEEPLNIREWINKVEWKSPKRTGISSIDEVYEMSDQLYKSIKEMGDSVPMYSLRSIVENNDTVAIVVVDQNSKPYNSLSAVSQMVSGGAHLTSITANAIGLTAKYGSLVKDVQNIAKSRGLMESLRIAKDVIGSSKKIGKITKDFLPRLREAYNKRGNPIKAYQKAQASLSPDDGFVNTGFDQVPEFEPEDMPSDEELDILLEQERSNRTN